jgi:hypothetical protein
MFTSIASDLTVPMQCCNNGFACVHCVDIFIDSCAPIYGTLVLQFRSQVLVRAINHVVCGLSVIAFVFRPAYYVDNCCSLVLAISTAIYINLCPCRKFIAT